MTTVDDCIMLIRSVLCSKKTAITLRDLDNEYYESNGSRIPFRQLGFDSLPAFLSTQPDKFRVQNHGSEYTICPVLDRELVDLAKLVQGQKSNKKKKKKTTSKITYKKPSLYSNFTFSKGIPTSSSTVFNRYSSSKPVNKNAANQNAVNAHSKGTTKATNPNTEYVIVPKKKSISVDKNNNLIKKNKLDGLPNNYKSVFNQNLASSMVIGNTNIDDLWITNATYFLKEHMVYLSHVESLNSIYIRLIDSNGKSNFSTPFVEMIGKLNQHLKKSRQFIDFKNTKDNSICVGLDTKSTLHTYCRLQILKKESEKKIQCFFVDEGRTEYFTITELFVIPEEFLKIKFQAVKVRVSYFEMLNENDHILTLIRNNLSRKKYLARRVDAKQLTISLYNAKNVCMDEKFFREYENFIEYKPTEGQHFSAFISFIDDESSLVYLQLPGDLKNKFDTKMLAINEYYNQLPAVNAKCDIEFFQKNINNLGNEVCCARYSLDNQWYRIKIMRKWNENSVLVHFIDFGNKEKVLLSDLRRITSQFIDFKYLPAQAFKVLILSKEYNENELKECLYDSKLVNFKVVKINSAGIASVMVISTIDVVEKLDEMKIETNDDEFESIDTSKGANEDQMNNSLFNKDICEEDKLNEIVHVMHKDLAETNLPCKSKVYVSYTNNPFDFVINLESSRKAYSFLTDKMNSFYMDKPSKYLCKEPVKDYVYVLRDCEKGRCTRVKFIDYFAGENARIYDIDAGNYDAVKINSNFFFITREFLKLKPLGIKAKLSNVDFDQVNQWSIVSKFFFISQVKNKKIFNANIINFDLNSNSFKIELYNENSDSINRILVNKGYAKAC